MSEYAPIIYIISAIGTEIIKDLAKHLGKKTYEKISCLREEVVKLDINNYADPREVQDKLDAKLGVKSEIESEIYNHKEEFNELLRFLNENPKLISNKFYSEGNTKVVNIETNHGNINM